MRVIDLVAEGQTLAIVMELISGQDLRRYLRAKGTLPPAEAVGLAVQLLTGLAAVHAAGVVHRDIKPENLLLDTSAGEVTLKVTDFGVARLSYGASLTKLTSLIGTPEYMAPELAEGGSADPAADLYSAGIVLYEMLSGRTPFAGGPPMAVLRRHADMAPPPVPGIPDGLWDQLSKMLGKDPADRPASATDAAEALIGQAAALAPLPALPLTAAPDSYQRAAPVGTGVPDGSGTTVVRHRERGIGPGAGVEVPPPSASAPSRSRARLRSAALLAVAVAVIAAAAIVIPSWLRHKPPVTSQPQAYSFAPQQYPGGLRLMRQWTLDGPGSSVFTETVTASAAGTAMRVRFYEAVPSAVAATLRTAVFTPRDATIVQGGHAVEWLVQVPATGSVKISYQITVPAGSSGKARLADWARGLGTAQAALPAPWLSGPTASANPARHTPTTPAGRTPTAGAVTGGISVAAPTAIAPSLSPGLQSPPSTQASPAPTPAPEAQVYASAPLATGSSSVTARVYFGQLSAVISALSGQVTFNTSASLLAAKPRLCVGTVVFSQVTNPTGAVFAEGLGSGWTAAENPPSQDTESGNLHQQLVVPPAGASAGQSWQASAELTAGSPKVQSGGYSLTLQRQDGSARTWLVDGQAVGCSA